MSKKKSSSQIWVVLLSIPFVFCVCSTLVLSHEKKTSKGNDVGHEHKPAFTKEEMDVQKRIKRIWEEQFGDRIQQVENDGPTRTYNCAGLVICNKTSWVTKLGTVESLRDEGYRPLKEGEKPNKGDFVLYYKDGQLQHIGIVEEVDENGKVKKVRSKWGESGEFIHDLDAVPSSYGTPTVETK